MHAARAVRQAEAQLRVESTSGLDTRSVEGAPSLAAIGTLGGTQLGRCPLALSPANGWTARQCRAMSTRRQIHTVVARDVVEEARESGPYAPSSEAGL